MIRDRLVVDVKLSEKPQIDATLSLEKAVNTARQSESAHKRQEAVRERSGRAEDFKRRRYTKFQVKKWKEERFQEKGRRQVVCEEI